MLNGAWTWCLAQPPAKHEAQSHPPYRKCATSPGASDWLPSANVLIMGDLLTTGSYPIIDESSRGSTLLSAEASPANLTTSATRAVGVVATMVWHAPSRPRPDCFRDARMDEALTCWFG